MDSQMRLKSILTQIPSALLLLLLLLPADSRSEEFLDAAYYNSRLEISIGGQRYYYLSNDLKEYINHIYRTAIDNGNEFAGRVAYNFTPRNSMVAGLGFYFKSLRGERIEIYHHQNGNITSSKLGDYDIDIKMVNISLAYRFRQPVKYVAFNITIGQTLCYSQVDHLYYDDTIYHLFSLDNRFNTLGAGFYSSIGIDHPIGKSVSLGLEGGYRYLRTGDLGGGTYKDSWRFDGMRDKEIDFSGPFFAAHLSVGR